MMQLVVPEINGGAVEEFDQWMERVTVVHGLSRSKDDLSRGGNNLGGH